jgi:hypothetical protein
VRQLKPSIVAVALCATCFAVCPTLAIAAAGPPNPCTVIHPSKVAEAFHQPSAPASHLTIRHEQGKTFRTCTWGKTGRTFSITTGPRYTVGGFGGPPGTMITRPVSGLGSESVYAHDDNPMYQYADVFFMHGPFSGDVHTNGNLPFADILSLARLVYKADG